MSEIKNAELNAALAKAQSQIKVAKKSSYNPFFKSNFADLAAVWEACRVALTSNGLSVTQSLEPRGDGWVLITTLRHSSGQEYSGLYPIITSKNDSQGFGAGVSYAKRYALGAMVGVIGESEDDDGESTVERDQPTKQPTVNTVVVKPEPKKKEYAPALPGCISGAQAFRFHTIASKFNWDKEQLKAHLLKTLGVDSSLKIPIGKYEEICNSLGQQIQNDGDVFL